MMWVLAVVICVAVIVVFGYAYGSRHFVVKEQTLWFDDLPDAFDGYRILQFSDFHAGAFHMGHDDDVEKIVEMINAQGCDMVCFTGDLVTRSAKELERFEQALSQIQAPDGVYSIMGNHDYAMYNHGWSVGRRKNDIQELQRKERAFGWNLLLNEHQKVYRDGDSIAVIGIENDGTPPHFPQFGDLEKASEGLADGEFKILLSHDPTSWQRHVLTQSDVQLTLSGHTHAGQFKMFGWSVVANVYDEWSGAYEMDGQQLFVSEGVGCVPFPYRIGAWPEVNVITLKRLEIRD